MSDTELLDNARQLEAKSFEKLYKNLTALRIQRHGVSVLDETETNLLAAVNREFNSQEWERLQYLDWKMEFGSLTEQEEAESLLLAEAYERYSVERLQALSQLATVRQVPLDELMNQLGMNA